MRFFQTVLLAASALASVAFADIKITAAPAAVVAGNSYIISYEASNPGPVEFTLRKGKNENLDTVSSLGTATGGNFTWVVAKTLPNGDDYALMITQGKETNYWGAITVTGGAASSSKASSSTMSSLSSSMSSLSATATSNSTTVTTATSTASAQSTSTHASSTRTGTSTSTTAAGAPASTGGAAGFSSPMALIFGAVAAMAYLN